MARNQVDIVLFAISDPGWHFIGLKDMAGNNNKSDYKWVHDGSPLTGYENWRPGEPDMASQRCVAMTGTEGKWYDAYCSGVHLSICEADVCTKLVNIIQMYNGYVGKVHLKMSCA